NAYAKTKEIRVIAGACNGGAALVIREGSHIRNSGDFKGKKIATPQLGNTQDVMARLWFEDQGLKIGKHNGDLHLIPTSNANQLALFIQNQIDGAWTVEPWVSRLEIQGNGKIYFEEKKLWKETSGKYSTTLLVTTRSLLENQKSLIKKWLEG